ncbi:recombination regulator RecX [Thiomonas intermedia]|uniref:recombination regulator RecX n=1 Tax=Thiomonas intermedia TaxID=926 RepID=UPI0009A47C53|nr:recombination regulator RecX [Thiomonas intermedia]
MTPPRAQPSLRARAVRYLSQREHSPLELRRKLLRYCEEADEVDALLASLEQAGLLSSERFAQSLIHRRQQRYGNLRIAQELEAHGLPGDATAALRQSLKDSELARAHAAWSRKFPTLPQDAPERARQARFLTQRGFSSDTVRAVLRGETPEASD